MAPVLQVFCLGRLSLHCRDGPELSARTLLLPATLKAQSLLAYLITHRGRPHTRDHLAELFWGDRPEHNAHRSLTTALWQIRRCLPGDEFLFTSAAAVQFNPQSAFWLDVTVFERLVRTPCGATDASSGHIPALIQAVQMYRGDFLDGFYDDWVLTERYRLESLYHDALAQLTAAREALGEYEAALATALRLLDHDPLREDAHRAVMRSYWRLGKRHAALEHYTRCEQVLAQELGVKPADETVALRQAIASGQLAAIPAAPRPPLPILVPARREPARHPLDAAGEAPLVGRKQELAVLAEGWQTALAGGCSLLLLGGETGVGKTRLVQEFGEQLRWQGAEVLQGRCYEFERLLPYQPIAEVLRTLGPGPATAALASLEDWVCLQVARLAPDIVPIAAEPAAGHEALGSAAESQERLFEAVALFLAQMARQQPLLLVLEDLHWATDSTLQVLHYLARALVSQPLLIVGTLRIEAASAAHPLVTLGRRLERDGLARRLALSRLSSQAVAELVDRMSGAGVRAAPLAHRLYLETEGNPFYLIQTIRALFEQGALRIENGAWQGDFEALGQSQLPLPAGVSETIAASVGRLGEVTQAALRVAAVLGREFDFDLLNRVWGKGEESTLAALDELLRCRLITEAAGGYGAARADYAFTHHKIQEVVFAAIPRYRRLYLHRLAGLEMERWLGPETASR
ncbi:MAG: ATP-binding protein, partial [Nitrososphaerales archaeon]